MRLHLAVLLLLVSPATLPGQSPPPADKCDFNGARLGAALRKVAGPGPAPYYFACQRPGTSGCLQGSLPPGLVVSVDREQSGWSCVTGGDSTSGWVQDSRLEALPTEPRPALSKWLGWWTRVNTPEKKKGDTLLLTTGQNPGSIYVSGRVYWYGGHDVVHFGSVKGESVPIGNHLHIVELDPQGEPSGCVLDLTLSVENGTSELQGNDNQLCGGMNVNFWGRWHKFTPLPAKSK